MINGNETIQKYSNQNKIYIPTAYYNQNYKYTISNDEITIITNKNCYTNYNTQYCDCYRYNEKYNIITNSYSCNSNPGNYQINYNYLSNDINDSYRITRDYTNNYTIYLLMILIVLTFTMLMKKNGYKV